MQSYGIQQCLLLILSLLAAQTTTVGQPRPTRSPSARTRPTLGRDPQPSRIPALQRTCAVTRRVPRQTTPGRRFGSFTDNLLSEGVRRLLARGQFTPRYPCRRVYFHLSEPGPSHHETAPLRSDLPSDFPGQTPGKAPRPKSLSESSLLSLEPKQERGYTR